MTQISLSSSVPELAAVRVSASSNAPLRWWAVLLIALLGALVFGNSVSNHFAYDDCGIIEHNDTVIDGQWAELWSGNYWPSHEGPTDVLYRPLTIWSYTVDHALGPTSYWHYHAVNIVLHALISAMVAILAWRLLENRAMALLAGLLFAVHPLHGEVVANVVGRAELLAAFWALLALLLFLPNDSRLLDGPPRKRYGAHGILVAACFFLGMLAKETPAPLLGAVIFIDVWRWSHWQAGRPTLRAWLGSQAMRFYLPLFGAFGIYMALRIHAAGFMMNTSSIHPVVNLLTEATIPQRMVTPFLLLAKYIMLMIWPKTLSADYSAPSILPTANLLEPMVLLGIALVVTAAAVVIANWKKQPRLVLAIVLFGFSYCLVANVIRIGTIFGERLFYWPSVFVVLIAAWCMVNLWQHATRAWAATRARFEIARLTGLAACAVMLAVLGTRTWDRNPIWYDNVALALATAEANPESCKACEWAGAVLLKETTTPWTIAFGESLIKRSIDLYTNNGLAYWELATYYGRANRMGESLTYLGLAARYFGGGTEIRGAFRAVDKDLARRDPKTYMPYLEAQLNEHPNSATVHFAYGIALRAQKRMKPAEAEFQKALDLDHNFAEAGAELGMTKGMDGDFVTAIKLLKYYVVRIRYNGVARCDLAGALMQVDPKDYPGAMAEAEMNLRKAETLLPGDPNVRKMQQRWITKMGLTNHPFTPLPID